MGRYPLGHHAGKEQFGNYSEAYNDRDRFGALLIAFSDLCALYLKTKMNVTAQKKKSRIASYTGFFPYTPI